MDFMTTSMLDRLYAGQSNRRLFFRQGWGDLDLLKEIDRNGFFRSEPKRLDIRWEDDSEREGIVIRHGSFRSPFRGTGLPEESRTGYVEFILPKGFLPKPPVCLHLAATGDEGFGRRRAVFGVPLARRGIGSLILENPFYGRRRPPDQHRKMLNRFSDLWIMGRATVEEGQSLLQWLREAGFERLGVCGISMGGHMAARIGALSSEPVAIAACVAPHSAGAVFTEGILKHYSAWDILNRQLDGFDRAVDFMGRILGRTDIRKYPLPARPDAAFLVAAARDAYIPPESASILHRHWPGSSLTWLNTGHVGAFLFHRKDFLQAAIRAFSRLEVPCPG